MSIEYDIYLKKHISAVHHGYSWILFKVPHEKLNSILPDLRIDICDRLIATHDSSKFEKEEYEKYDEYFYKGGKGTEKGEKEFSKAFLMHLHKNPHHWQYWVLIDDDGDFMTANGRKLMAFDMPDNYILEMICDWWSFSWNKYLEELKDTTTLNPSNSLNDIFTWYDEHKTSILFSDKTREKVEKLLDELQYAITMFE